MHGRLVTEYATKSSQNIIALTIFGDPDPFIISLFYLHHIENYDPHYQWEFFTNFVFLVSVYPG